MYPTLTFDSSIGDKIMLDLLKYIHQYYPIGLPEYYNQPRRMIERDHIVANKINDLIEGKETAWSLFVKELKKRDWELLDMAFIQFPSYVVHIKLKTPDFSTPEILHQRELVVVVSLLCPYYTIYYLDTYRFNTIRAAHYRFGPIFRITFKDLLPEFSFDQEALLKEVEDLTKQYFPSHNYASHGMLMNRYLTPGIILEGQSGAGPYPIYSYLFDHTFNFKNLEIR
ncbi:hypothetical protein [Chitinophaga polysaccharea]|uniref:hypothetical protein n=1 Tax=Chitinophaga polysaccharea TaxID=1293035 RepID=UPI00115A6BF5|nr:hypothetical protein [Chitinophaga polysaccharea]